MWWQRDVQPIDSTGEHCARLFDTDRLSVRRIARALSVIIGETAPKTSHETLRLSALVASSLASAPGFKAPRVTRTKAPAPAAALAPTASAF